MPLIEKHGSARVVVAVDARGGKVSLAGWTESSGVDVADAVSRPQPARASSVSCSRRSRSTARWNGPNIPELIRVAAATTASVIASGGVGDLEPPAATWPREAPANVEGVIVGKALFEGRFTVAEGDRSAGCR